MKKSSILICIIIGLIGGTILAIKYNTNIKQPKKYDYPCTSQPCIKIVQQNGTDYNLNDFRFVAGHCILFISLPDQMHRETCGQYHLVWIGPKTSKGVNL